jgi:hypothetical protein
MALQFFGFTLDRVQPGKDRDLIRKKNQEEQPASFVPPTADDGSTAIAAGGYYGQYLDLEGDAAKTDVDLIRKYRVAAEMPECDSAIEDIVNESIVHEEYEAPVDINLDDLEQPNSIKKEIKAEFDRICQLLNFNINGQDIFRRWYVDGRVYFHIIIDEENRDEGILELRAVDAIRIRKVREIKEETDSATGARVIKTLDEYYLYQDGGLQKSDVGLKINKDAICYVPSGILDASRKRVLSPLHKALKPVNQLRMMEDALVIYRLSRAPERRIFYIDVGNLPKGKAEEYMRHIMNQYRNKLVYDAVTGEIRDDRKHMSMLEDFWLPRREGGRGTEITTLPGGENLSQIDDILFFQKKLYNSLNVPVTRMDPQNGFNLGKASEISRDEVKFQKFIDKLRKKFSALFTELLRVQLVLKGVITEEDWPELKETLRFDFRKDNYFTELKESELMNERIQLLNNITPYVGKYFSENWVRRHVLRMTDEDIEQLEQEMQEDSELNAQKMLENPQMDTGSGVEDISANQEFDRSA